MSIKLRVTVKEVYEIVIAAGALGDGDRDDADVSTGLEVEDDEIGIDLYSHFGAADSPPLTEDALREFIIERVKGYGFGKAVRTGIKVQILGGFTLSDEMRARITGAKQLCADCLEYFPVTELDPEEDNCTACRGAVKR